MSFFDTAARAKAYLREHGRISVGGLRREFDLDDEDLCSVVRASQEAASGVIERYAGHIAQYLGDGLLVYFGHPQAHEDDAERAVRAGLEILAALRTLNDALEPEHGIRLAARVGIHTGPVVIGAMGGGAKSETLALGDTTNVAARLEAVAAPDTVVMSGATQRLVPGMFLLQDLGTPPLEGIATPIHAYAVLQATGVRSRLDVAAGRLTRFVGSLAGAELPVATLDALVARADGVPLYVEELTKAIAEPGAARGVEAIPASLADSLMARLDRLSTAKEVAQRAAVLGREFGYPLLAAMVGMDEAALRHGLGRLVDAEILFARGEPPAATYTFKHALIQETAYQSLLRRTRQQLHARVGEVLEERFPELVAAEPEVIARHYDQAGLPAQAIGHYQRAGERATQRSANEEAIGHLRRALALVATLPETRERHQMELGLQMAIGAPLAAARGWPHPEFEGTYARARELTSQIGESHELPQVLVGMAVAYFVKGDRATAAEVAQEALVTAERTRDGFDLLSAHFVAGPPLFFQGHFSQALRHFDVVPGVREVSSRLGAGRIGGGRGGHRGDAAGDGRAGWDRERDRSARDPLLPRRGPPEGRTPRRGPGRARTRPRGAARRHQPGAPLAAPGQARRRPRPPRPALRLVQRRLRHAT